MFYDQINKILEYTNKMRCNYFSFKIGIYLFKQKYSVYTYEEGNSGFLPKWSFDHKMMKKGESSKKKAV